MEQSFHGYYSQVHSYCRITMNQTDLFEIRKCLKWLWRYIFAPYIIGDYQTILCEVLDLTLAQGHQYGAPWVNRSLILETLDLAQARKYWVSERERERERNKARTNVGERERERESSENERGTQGRKRKWERERKLQQDRPSKKGREIEREK